MSIFFFACRLSSTFQLLVALLLCYVESAPLIIDAVYSNFFAIFSEATFHTNSIHQRRQEYLMRNLFKKKLYILHNTTIFLFRCGLETVGGFVCLSVHLSVQSSIDLFIRQSITLETYKIKMLRWGKERRMPPPTHPDLFIFATCNMQSKAKSKDKPCIMTINISARIGFYSHVAKRT